MRYIIIVLFTVIFILTSCSSAEARKRNIETTGVTINRGSIEMIIGTTEQLTAWVEPTDATDRSIYWFSSDKEIATVRSTGHSSAEVKAEGGGETWVTVATVDGNWRSSCKITVTVPVLEIFMEQVALNLEPSDKHQFEAFIEPENATNPVLHWSSSDNFVISVDENGLAEALSPGTARVIARADENDDLYAYCTVTVGKEANAEPTEKEPAQKEEPDLYNEEETEEEGLDETIEANDEEQTVDLDYVLIALGAVIVLLLITLITVIVKKRR